MDTKLQNLIKNYNRHKMRFDEERKNIEKYFSENIELAVNQKDFKKSIELWNLCPDVVTSAFICDYLVQHNVIERPRYFQE